MQQQDRRRFGERREKAVAVAISVATLGVAFFAWVGPGIGSLVSYPGRVDAAFKSIEWQLDRLEEKLTQTASATEMLTCAMDIDEASAALKDVADAVHALAEDYAKHKAVSEYYINEINELRRRKGETK